jgi:hypothetical protein
VRPVGIIHRRQQPLNPTVTRFVQLLQEASAAPPQTAGRRV